MKILALDTSSQYASIALCDGTQVVFELTIRGVATQSEHLVPSIQHALDTVGWTPGDLEAYGVVHGPGSFTGIRVGLATVEGLAFGTGRPALGVSSLEALAWGMPPGTVPICPVLNARRGDVYAAVYERHGEGLVERMPQCSIAPRALAERLEGDIVVLGDGASLLVEARTKLGRPGRTLVPVGSSALLRASVVATRVAHRLEQLEGEPVPPLRPTYIRETIADLGLRRPAERLEVAGGSNRKGRTSDDP